MTPADDQAGHPQLREIADRAAESIRAINHLTPGALGYPGDLYEVIAGLTVMAQRLPQLLSQLSAWLEAEHAAGRIAHDTRQAPEQYVQDVNGSLVLAAVSARTVAKALSTAHNACSGLKVADPQARERPAKEDAGS